jgi:serine/threonine protein kinase
VIRSSWGFTEGEVIASGRHAVRLLGGGRRYEAYLAWDDELHALVVVKLLRPAFVDDPSMRRALRTEARALERLAHPAIVRAYDVRLEDGRPHLVLEYLDGPRLSTLLRRYGLAVEQVLPLALQLCGALHYLAGRGMVHLDVKPRNVIMNAPPRLIDLSVANTIEGARTTTRFVGTDAYMAPEQCDPDRFPDIGPPTDVWGLGVTLYEALARSGPFSSADDAARFPQLDACPLPLPDRVPAAVAEPVLACLEPEPADRPTAAELAAALEPLASDLPRPRLSLFRPGGRTELHSLR